jgi:hypothetical protein
MDVPVTDPTRSERLAWHGADLDVYGHDSAKEILISDTPSAPLVFADLLQNDDQTDLLYADGSSL